jgi:predicted MPP superfamily phosphohydrolase
MPAVPPDPPSSRAGRGLLGLGAAVTTGALAGAAALGYGWCEARWFTVRELRVPALPPGAPSVKVLHLSDLHFAPYQGLKRDWIASLARWKPDLVVNTGDNIAHRHAVGPLLDAWGPLLDVPGVFVLGSNDYFEPTLRNPFAYLLPDRGKRHVRSPHLPWRELTAAMESRGWVSLQNRRATLEVNGLRLAFAGVDDPHLGYDELPAVHGRAEAQADLRVGVAHAPYLRVLDQFAADGYDAILAGHTHGGQLRLPGTGALVTNCDLETARARGLHRHPADSSPGDPGSSWLHVSAGAGTSPYVVVRICCRPEATLLTLTPRPDFGPEGRLG